MVAGTSISEPDPPNLIGPGGVSARSPAMVVGVGFRDGDRWGPQVRSGP